MAINNMKFRSDKLDEIDNTILDMLLADSRTPLSHISKEVGISSPAIRERIKKLKQEGIIKGFSTIIDYKKLGLGLTAFIKVLNIHLGTTFGRAHDTGGINSLVGAGED